MKISAALMSFVFLFSMQGADAACTQQEWRALTKNGTVEYISQYVKSNQCDINQELDDISRVPLVYAVEAKNSAAVAAIINAGGDVNYDGYDGKTPLFYAVEGKSFEVAKYLIAHGADVNAYTRTSGMTILMVSVLESVPKIISLLVSHGASLSDQDKYGQRPVDYVKKLPLAQQKLMHSALHGK